jgi:hypothetical protein
MVELYLISSIAMTVIAVVAIFYGLKDAQLVRRWPLVIGFGLLIVVCLLTAIISTQDWGGILAIMTGIYYLGIIVLVASLAMLLLLPKWRKAVALLIGIAFPLLFWQSMLIGSEGSPDAITRRNGILMAQALNAFYAEHHMYPMALEELAPKYLATIPADPQSAGGWLYRLTTDGFALGYVSWVDRFGYSVCVLTPQETHWDCSPITRNGEPFSLGPTPVPTRTRMPEQ